MLRTILVLVLSVSVFMPANAQFRDIDWGTPEEEVIRIEGGDYRHYSLGNDRALLIYDRDLLDYEVSVRFLFYSSRLRSGDYDLNEVPSNLMNRVREALRAKYGDASFDEWSRMEWLTDTTRITLGNVGGSQLLLYTDRHWFDRSREESSKEDAEQF